MTGKQKVQCINTTWSERKAILMKVVKRGDKKTLLSILKFNSFFFLYKLEYVKKDTIPTFIENTINEYGQYY